MIEEVVYQWYLCINGIFVSLYLMVMIEEVVSRSDGPPMRIELARDIYLLGSNIGNIGVGMY